MAADPSTTDPSTAATPGDPPSAGPHGTWRAVRDTTALFGVVLLLGVGLFAGTGRYVLAPDDHDAAAMAGMVAPEGVLDLARVQGTVAAEYRYAADHPEEYRQLRCWCGCEAAFDHADLWECFVRADGQWEAHGAGCAVCLAEGRIARLRLEEGVPIAQISAEIDAAYGPASIPGSPSDPTSKDTSR